MAEMKHTTKHNAVDLSQENLFELQCLIKVNNIQHAATNENFQKYFVAFVSDSSDLGLYYLKDASSLPVIKKVPWFQCSRKKIACLCFDPQGLWLLTATIDGSLYIVPVTTYVDECYPSEQKWTTKDITSFSSVNAQNTYARPSAIVWWQSVTFSGQMCIIGTEQGEIVFINLETGQEVAITKVDGRIVNLTLCQDTDLDTVTLLITNHTHEQWHLILEKPSCNYCFPLNNGTTQRTEETDNDDSKTFPIARARLRGLKQLSVQKLVILKQKLAETRNRNYESNTPNSTITTDNHSNDNHSIASSNGNEYCNDTCFYSSQQSDINKISVTPVAVCNDMYIIPQYKSGQTTYINYLSSTNHLTIYQRSTTAIPSHIHKLPEHCEYILLTTRFFYILDKRHKLIYVVSRPLSKIRKKDKSDFNWESIVARCSFERNGEVINSIHILSHSEGSCLYSEKNESKANNVIVKDITDLKVNVPPVDSCLVITNFGVYKIIFRNNVVSLFMDLILKRRAIEDATKLGLIFGLNAQQLVEYAGDTVLCNRQFGRAMEFYSLAGCYLLKSLLKFASAGYTSELLKLLIAYLTPPVVGEISETNKIHISNLSVLAYTEVVLRASSSHNKIFQKIHRDFLHFLSTNTYYDELFAINIIIQSNLWSVLQHLISSRGLGPQVLEDLFKSLPSFMSKNINFNSQQNTNGLLICLSESNLIQGMLIYPVAARNLILFVIANLSTFPIFILQRLLTLYDPTNPTVRPLLLRIKARRRTISQSSFSSQCDSFDNSDESDELNALIEEIIEVFLQTLVTLIHQKKPALTFFPKFIPLTNLADIEEKTDQSIVFFNRRSLSAGFGHTALIRNGNIFTWGNSMQGCLGTGPSIPRYQTPQEIAFFRNLGIEVTSVSCGRCHNLAVTNNGVYAWGGSEYGQLGLGEVLETPNPELITTLGQEIVIEAVAGQYHSVALTVDGRVFTWGWGLHGQLGLGSTELKRHPKVVKALLGVPIRHASAGYAHTLLLSSDGYVYGFGCGMYGQMGTGNDCKATSPVKISLLPEKITLITTKYFHNLAVSCSNRLYVWGSNPQVLRLQGKERRLRLQKAKQAVSDALDREIAEKSNSTTPPRENPKEQELTEMKKSMSDTQVSAPTKVTAEIESEEESYYHFVPDLVDTSLVNGKIVQISAGYYHSALLSQDGVIYTWGRNHDGQLGTGNNRDIHVPTPLTQQNFETDEDHIYNENKDHSRSKVKALKICCGSNFTVAIQPGGSVLAWGSNNKAQLGRPPLKSGTEELVIKFKSSKRIIRRANPAERVMAIDLTPSQVSDIPTPTISYESIDVKPFSGTIHPLNYIETNFDELTLHYALEQFHGLYGTFKILDKCKELKNYQACAKLELLEHNLVEAMTHQLKAVSECDPSTLEPIPVDDPLPNGENGENNTAEEESREENNKLFEKQVERNLVDTLMESVEKQKIKMAASKSLDSFRVENQELHTFDCQGGSEEMFDEAKRETIDPAMETDNYNDDGRSSSNDSVEIDNENSLCDRYDKLSLGADADVNGIVEMNEAELLKMRHAANVVDFYLREIEDDAIVSMYELAAVAVNFWVENNFAIEELEKLFDKHMKKIFYSLGLLIYGSGECLSNSNMERNIKNIQVKNATKVLSTKFCLKVCCLILKHIEEGKPVVEFIEMLSTSLAKNYGPPLIGYPGTSENRTAEQMMEGIISTLSARFCDPRPFIHIKDSDKVSKILSADEDSMIFTCGHQYFLSSYQSEVIPHMEADLLALKSPLPSTAQLLGSIFYQSHKPETLCPPCLTRVLKNVFKNDTER